jgi:uncharacterized protein YbjT (DUF2867 family)
MQTPMKIAVVGATGRVGRHVVDVLKGEGHDVAAISRSNGVDVITGAGLAVALTGAEAIIDVSTSPTPDQRAAVEFFTTSAANLHEYGTRAGAQRLIVVSIIGVDQSTGGYGRGKLVHEQQALAGPIPTCILRASQFHEFVGQLVDWGTQGDTAYVPVMRTQLVASRTVAEALAALATDPDSAPAPGNTPVAEIAGPRAESLVDMAKLLVARRGNALQIQGVSDPDNPDERLAATGGLLPSPHATLAGPTFEEWLDSNAFAEWLDSTKKGA